MDEHTQRGTTSREEEGNVDGLRQWSDTTMVIHYVDRGAGWHQCSRGVQANLDQKQRKKQPRGNFSCSLPILWHISFPLCFADHSHPC